MTDKEEDFWNTSNHSGFNFDEDDETSAEFLNNTVFKSATEVSSVLPVHAIISKTNLDRVLNDVKLSSNIPMTNDGHYVLSIIDQPYIRFNDKVNILQRALETYDGNIIIKTILYLKRTLKSNIFYHQIAKSKSAVKHYSSYLLLRNDLNAVSDLYMATGNSQHMKYLYYQVGEGVSSKAHLYKKLQQFNIDHLQKLQLSDDIEISEHFQLLNFQVDCYNSKSVVAQLSDLCKHDFGEKDILENLNDFKKTFRIDDYVFEWTLMNTLAHLNQWKILMQVFIKNNWFTKRAGLKTVIPLDIFLVGLNKHHPPNDVLEGFLKCISDTKKAVILAKKLECFSYLTQYGANQI
ncbi:hypothetical protein ABEB36_011246 [Hypothenemus hampei]|uniref:Vps16 C-terminal domain-containing protein n=1 Tax=Hypothenemus hampei TaxID=57062 RepID=A0ABD1EER1_HYPHA